MTKRRVGLLVLVLASAGGVAVFVTRDDSKYVWTQTKWLVGSISADQRKLTLAFPSGGCTSDTGRARFEESTKAVRIRVESRDPRDVQACTLDLRGGRATIRLRRPLSGRRIFGASRIGYFEPIPGRYVMRGDRLVFRVPRVTGLAVIDAERLLDSHGFDVKPTEGTGVATGTSPAMGVPTRRPVRVITSAP